LFSRTQKKTTRMNRLFVCFLSSLKFVQLKTQKKKVKVKE